MSKLAGMLSMAQKKNDQNPEAIGPNVKVSEERVNEKEFEKGVFIAQL